LSALIFVPLGVSGVNAKYYEIVGEPAKVPFDRRDYYKIWLIGNRDGHVRYPGRSVPIDRPALVFINPLVPYAYDGQNRERTGYWCVFTEEFLKAHDRMGNLQESPMFSIGGEHVFFPDDEQLKVVTFLFDRIIAELESNYLQKFNAVRNYIHLLIHEGMKMRPALSGPHPQNAASRITTLFLELLERQFPIETPGQPLRLKKPGDFAGELAVHVNHLNAVVREVTGKSTSAHIAERVVNEGKALLEHTAWSIADIAYGLGFEYPNHFNTFFKKHTGDTPLSFRKN
jgi:AraC family transcriptional activator of pobA